MERSNREDPATIVAALQSSSSRGGGGGGVKFSKKYCIVLLQVDKPVGMLHEDPGQNKINPSAPQTSKSSTHTHTHALSQARHLSS